MSSFPWQSFPLTRQRWVEIPSLAWLLNPLWFTLDRFEFDLCMFSVTRVTLFSISSVALQWSETNFRNWHDHNQCGWRSSTLHQSVKYVPALQLSCWIPLLPKRQQPHVPRVRVCSQSCSPVVPMSPAHLLSSSATIRYQHSQPSLMDSLQHKSPSVPRQRYSGAIDRVGEVRKDICWYEHHCHWWTLWSWTPSSWLWRHHGNLPCQTHCQFSSMAQDCGYGSKFLGRDPTQLAIPPN